MSVTLSQRQRWMEDDVVQRDFRFKDYSESVSPSLTA